MDQALLIKTLREKSGAGVMDCKKALDKAKGNIDKALIILKEKGLDKAKKRAERQTLQGLIFAYVHGNGRIGAMLELNCETDFVARTDEFKGLALDLSLQIASMNPQNTDELLSQEFIKDPQKTVKDVIQEIISKTGENIQVRHFARYELGG